MTSFGLPAPRTTGPLWQKIANKTKSGVYPPANMIAVALIEACALAGGDAIACASGKYHQNGRRIAYFALADEYPCAPREAIARAVGFKDRGIGKWLREIDTGIRDETYRMNDQDIPAIDPSHVTAVRRAMDAYSEAHP